jgi:hypothetical protein
LPVVLLSSLLLGFQQSEHQHPFVSFTEDKLVVSQNSSIQLASPLFPSLLLVFCGFGRRVRKHYGTPGCFPSPGWRRTQSGEKISRTRREQREGKGGAKRILSSSPPAPRPLTCAPDRDGALLLTCCPRPMPVPCPHPDSGATASKAAAPRTAVARLGPLRARPARQIFKPHLASRAGRWWATATHRARVPRPVLFVARHGHAAPLTSL